MTWSPRHVSFLVLLCCGLAAPGLLPQVDPIGVQADPVAAEALWAWARSQSDDLAHPAYVDATEALSALRPWHPGYAEAQRRIEAVGRARARTRAR